MKQLICCLLIGLSSYGFSQSRLMDIQSNQFDHLFGFDFREINSGYLIAGTGESNTNAGFYCWITKTDAGFNTIWSKKFRLSGNTYQVNSMTITLSTLANDQIILLAKTRDEDSVYTDLVSFDQNGNFGWGKNWTDPYILTESVDMNEIVPLSDSTFHISHSMNGNTHVALKSDGTTLTSRYTRLTDPNDTLLGISTLLCSDGGILHILRSHARRTVLVKLDAQHQISWAKEIQSANRFVWMVNSYENPDGSFWVFGSINKDQLSPQIDQSPSVMKVASDGNVLGVYYFDAQIIGGNNLGIAQIYPIGLNEFEFNSTESEIGSINLNTGIIQAEKLDIYQANHGFQNLHKLNNDYYVLTGMGANWVESKIHVFPGIADHPCLNVFLNMNSVNQDTIPMQEMQITNVAAIVDNYSLGNAFNPAIETADISFAEECYLGLEETDSDLGLTIYPNPANSNEFVKLKLNGKYSFEKINVSIFDLRGNRVFYSEWNGSTDSHFIDTRSFQAGMYFVNCSTVGNLKNFTGKLVIR